MMTVSSLCEGTRSLEEMRFRVIELRVGEESACVGVPVGPNEGRLGPEGRKIGPNREVSVDHRLVGEGRIIVLVVHVGVCSAYELQDREA